MTTGEIKKFIVDTLLPYNLDESKCGYNDMRCVYLTDDGNKCAVGRHMVEGEWQQAHSDNMPEGSGVLEVFNKWGWQKVLTPNAKLFHVSLEEQAKRVWSLMQSYHDNIATGRKLRNRNIVVELEGVIGANLDELK